MSIAIPAWQGKNDRQKAIGGNVFEAAREAGVILQGLELRLGASLTWGRLRERVTPRSARSWAVHLLVIGAPRSECRVSTWGSMPCLRQVSSIRRERGVLPIGNHPAHDAAEDVEQDIVQRLGGAG